MHNYQIMKQLWAFEARICSPPLCTMEPRTLLDHGTCQVLEKSWHRALVLITGLCSLQADAEEWCWFSGSSCEQATWNCFLPVRNFCRVFSLPSQRALTELRVKKQAVDTAVDPALVFPAASATALCPTHRVSGFWVVLWAMSSFDLTPCIWESCLWESTQCCFLFSSLPRDWHIIVAKSILGRWTVTKRIGWWVNNWMLEGMCFSTDLWASRKPTCAPTLVQAGSLC